MRRGSWLLTIMALLIAAPSAAQPEPEPATEPVKKGTLEVRVKGEEGTIFVDGERVGWGIYKGEVEVGEHTIKVTRPGYETFERTVTIKTSEVRSESVALTQSAAGDEDAQFDEGDWTFDGLYGGVQLHGMFIPSGSGNTLDDSCDTLGATTCDGSVPAGGAIAGYTGYAFAPLGFEIMLLAGADVAQPSANFDGVNGSDINPLVATPARDESFRIARFGGGGALRVRVLVPIDRFRVTGAVGFGLAYRFMLLARDAMSTEGATAETSDDGLGYVTPVLSLELAGQVRLGATTSLALGFNLWLEHAGSDLQTVPRPNVLLTGGSGRPRALNTPAYDMAAGTQVFLGPFVGVQFGP